MADEDFNNFGLNLGSIIPNIHMPDFSSQLKVNIPKLPISTLNPAQWMYERLIKYLSDFESKLDSDHEVGARLVSFNSSTVFHIQSIGFHGPDIITFYGLNEDDERLQLIQHVSQLNVLLIAVKKIGEKPIRIGFELGENLNEKKNDEENK